MTAVLKLLGFVLFTAPAFALPPGILRGFPGVEEGSATCTPGLYAKGCGQEVSVCTEEGKVVELVCPFSLWFDELAESCVPPADVTFCRAMDSSASILPSASLPSSFCDGLPNGFHPVSQCSTTMARCVNGTGSMFECPAGQVYMKGGCTNMDEAKECQNIANDDECSSDGLFEVDTCSPLFLACGSGLSHIMTCPWPLVFDPQTQVCNYDYEVDGCPLKPNTMCPADGFYSYGNCSDTFYACTGDFIQPMNCPAQLAFDGERKLCDYPKAVPECNNGSGEGSGDESGSGEASGESSGEASGESSGEASGESSGEASGESSGEASGESSGEESGFDSPYSSALNSNTCDNRADGFYADGCSSTLIGCSNGITNILYCPSKLAFDETRVLCDYPGAVDACRNQGSGSGEEGSGEEGSGTASGEGSGSGDVQQLDSPYASI